MTAKDSQTIEVQSQAQKYKKHIWPKISFHKPGNFFKIQDPLAMWAPEAQSSPPIFSLKIFLPLFLNIAGE